MNNTLARIIDASSKKFNKNVVEGPAKTILKSAPAFLDEIITSTIKTMGHSGLEYHGWRRLGPKEEFNRLFTTNGSKIPNKDKKTMYDMARSDLYLIELRFVYRGTPMSRYLYLPYADRGNLIKLSDTYYNIVPVLSDTVISPDAKKVFVRLLKEKLTFERTYTSFIVDQERIVGSVIYSSTYRLAGRTIADNLGKMHPPVALYTLGEIGLCATLNKYLGIDNAIITVGDIEDYRKGYKVYESAKIKPKGLKEFNYVAHNLKVLIPRDKVTEANTALLDNFIFGMLYTLDVFPDSVPDLITILDNHDVTDEKMFWRIALGRIVFRNSYSIDKVVSDMNDHFNMIQNYMDSLIINKLEEVGVHAQTFFDLTMVILSKYNEWLLNSKEHNSNIDNRYVDILYYILYDVIYGINRALYDISKKSNKKVLSENEVSTIFGNYLTLRLIHNITKSTSMNLTIALSDYPGDIMYPKITSTLEDQSRGNGVKRGKNSQFPEATKTLKGQDLVIGSLLFLGKNAPSPRFKSNPYMNYDINTGRLLIDDETKLKVKQLDQLLLGKAPEDKRIIDSEQVVSLDQID